MTASLSAMQEETACWSVNEDGHWCPSCGELIARPEWLESGAHLPDECRQCGYPDAQAVAEYHCGPDDDEFDPEGPEFECAGYYPEPAGEFYCPLWGTEECDWECPHGGMA